MKLNMGCGFKKIPGYINIDNSEICHPDKLLDVTDKLPFKDNEVEYIYADNLWEHIGTNFIDMVREWYRISRNGAVWRIIVPTVDTHAAFQDPTHVRFFCEETFDYFDIKHSRWKNYGQLYGIPKFEKISLVRKDRFLICELKVIK